MVGPAVVGPAVVGPAVVGTAVVGSVVVRSSGSYKISGCHSSCIGYSFQYSELGAEYSAKKKNIQ